MRFIAAPLKGTYPAYAEMYLNTLPPATDVLQYLSASFNEIKTLVSGLSEEQLLFRYEPGKWSIKEVLVHLVDDERIYSYRALRFARNDHAALPGFDQDEYNRYAEADQRRLDNILDEYATVRFATISLFNNLPEASLDRGGVADNHETSVRGLVWHIAGHQQHHINIIRQKYLTAR